MPIFGAAYAAPNKNTTILYWFRSLSTVLSPVKNIRIQGLFKAFEWFSNTFQGRLIFKDFSRKSSKFKYFSSLCEPCTSFVVCLLIYLWSWIYAADIQSRHYFQDNKLLTEYWRGLTFSKNSIIVCQFFHPDQAPHLDVGQGIELDIWPLNHCLFINLLLIYE